MDGGESIFLTIKSLKLGKNAMVTYPSRYDTDCMINIKMRKDHIPRFDRFFIFDTSGNFSNSH